jgi:hypothetical protein
MSASGSIVYGYAQHLPVPQGHSVVGYGQYLPVSLGHPVRAYSQYLPQTAPAVVQAYSQYLPKPAPAVVQAYSQYIPQPSPSVVQAYSQYIPIPASNIIYGFGQIGGVLVATQTASVTGFTYDPGVYLPSDFTAGNGRLGKPRSSETSALDIRWIPRWMDSYYEDNTLLKKWYYIGTQYSAYVMRQLLRGTLIPKFYGETGVDRYLFIAKYHYPKTYIPHVALYYSDTSSAVVKAMDSMGSLMYEQTSPCYYRGESNIYFKNLDMISIATTATSGVIQLATSLATYPKESDSPFIVENAWGDQTYIDQTHTNYYAASGIISVPHNGNYTVYYRSSQRFSNLLSQASYIKIDNALVEIKYHQLSNVWDYFAELVSINRNKRETNSALKRRSQHMTIATKPNQKIAAALGLTVGISWYTSGAVVNTSASGYNDWQIQDYTRALYIQEEIPVKDGNNFVLTYAPTGFIHITLNGSKIHDDSYTVSGSYIISDSILLQQASVESIRVTYKHQRMKDRNYPESGNLYADVPDGLQYRGILVKDDVVVENTIYRIKEQEWRWNKDQGLVTGIAGFDF